MFVKITRLFAQRFSASCELIEDCMELEGSRIVGLSVWRVFSQLETVLSLLKESSHSLPGPVVGCLDAFLLLPKGWPFPGWATLTCLG